MQIVFLSTVSHVKRPADNVDDYDFVLFLSSEASGAESDVTSLTSLSGLVLDETTTTTKKWSFYVKPRYVLE